MKKVYVIGCVICLLLISLVSSTLYDTIFSPEESKKNVTFITSGTNSSFYFDINYPTELNKGTFDFWGYLYEDICEQNNASDNSNGCGLTTGTYSFNNNFNDNNYSTYTVLDNGPYYINYTKPEGYATTSTWQVKSITPACAGGETEYFYNLSINTSCFTPDILQLRVVKDTSASPKSASFQCYSGSSWLEIKKEEGSQCIIDNDVYLSEESMYWYINSYPEDIQVNFSNNILLFIDGELRGNNVSVDNFYNNQDNIIFGIDDNEYITYINIFNSSNVTSFTFSIESSGDLPSYTIYEDNADEYVSTLGTEFRDGSFDTYTINEGSCHTVVEIMEKWDVTDSDYYVSHVIAPNYIKFYNQTSSTYETLSLDYYAHDTGRVYDISDFKYTEDSKQYLNVSTGLVRGSGCIGAGTTSTRLYETSVGEYLSAYGESVVSTDSFEDSTFGSWINESLYDYSPPSYAVVNISSDWASAGIKSIYFHGGKVANDASLRQELDLSDYSYMMFDINITDYGSYSGIYGFIDDIEQGYFNSTNSKFDFTGLSGIHNVSFKAQGGNDWTSPTIGYLDNIRLYDKTLSTTEYGNLYVNIGDVTNTSCYQEQSNESTVCGGLSTGTYSFSNNFSDGDYNTLISLSDDSSYYVNYTIPSRTLSGLAKYKFNNSECSGMVDSSTSIPSGCLVKDNNLLEMEYELEDSCFLLGTQIKMFDGTSKNIEEIKIGDIVQTFNGLSFSNQKVTNTFYHPIQEREYLIINDRLKITTNHPIILNNEWYESSSSKVGDYLLLSNGQYEQIYKIESVSENVDVYNLEVENTHTYFAEDILVHNKIGIDCDLYKHKVKCKDNTGSWNEMATYGMKKDRSIFDYYEESVNWTLYDDDWAHSVNQSWCFQESANATNQTGLDGDCNLDYSGVYSDNDSGGYYSSYIALNAYDGDWDTYSAPKTSVTNYINTFINYTKPIGASNNSLWTVKDYNATINLSVAECWDYDSDKLILRAKAERTGTLTGNVTWYCYNGEWVTLRDTYEDILLRIYEEAMWWYVDKQTSDDLSSDVNDYLTSCTLTSDGRCQVPIKIGSKLNHSFKISDVDMNYTISSTTTFDFASIMNDYATESYKYLNITSSEPGIFNLNSINISSYITVISPTTDQKFLQDIPTSYLNVSTEISMDSCLWSSDTGLTNYSLTSINSTYFYNDTVGLTLLDGNHNVTYYCNSSADGTWYTSERIDFFIDSINITTCRDLAVSDRKYELINDLTYQSSGINKDKCLSISNDNIILDGNNYNISLNNNIATYPDYECGILIGNTNNGIVKNMGVLEDSEQKFVGICSFSTSFTNYSIYDNTFYLNRAYVLSGIRNNTFYNNRYIEPSGGSNLLMSGSSSYDNLFRDESMTLGFIVYSNVFNTTFLNVTGTDNSPSSRITRLWYLDGSVYGISNPIEEANVTVYNVSGDVISSFLTDSSGNINQTNITEYVFTTYHTPHTINITKEGYYTNSTTYDITETHNINFNVSLLPNTYYPYITLYHPEEQTYGFNESLPLNYSISSGGTIIDSCWYTIINSSDGIIINNETLSSCNNGTFDVPYEDNYNLTLYVNNTIGTTNSRSILFSVSLTGPAIVLNYPTSNAYLNNGTNIDFNFTVTDGDGISICRLYSDWNGSYEINDTYDDVVSGIEYSVQKNISNGEYNWNVWCNDTLDFDNYALNNKTFTIDSKYPVLDLTSPNGTLDSRTNISVNWTVSDLTSIICKYNVYRGITLEVANTTIDCDLNVSTFDVTLDASFILNFYATDYLNHTTSDSSSFVVDTTVPVTPSSPGGGGKVIIKKEEAGVEFSITSDIGGTFYEFVIANDDFRTRGITVENMGVALTNLKLECDGGPECNWMLIDETSISLEEGESKDIDFTISVPDNAEKKDYKMAIRAIYQDVSGKLDIDVSVSSLGTIFKKVIWKPFEGLSPLVIPVWLIWIFSLLFSFVGSILGLNRFVDNKTFLTLISTLISIVVSSLAVLIVA